MKSAGFTLTEVMIVVAIVGVLTAIAIPNYNEYVIKSARTEAITALLDAANKQEQYFVDNRKYTATLADISVNAKSDNGSYSISITSDGNIFTLTATAYSGVALKDSGCTAFSITDAGIKNSTGGESKETCWGK